MNILPLNQLPKDQQATIHTIGKVPKNLNMTQEEFEKRLLEMGLDSGTPVALLHKGPFNKDPVAVRVRNCYTVAIRRSEAQVLNVVCSQKI